MTDPQTAEHPIESLARVERRAIEAALARCRGNVREAAQRLEVAPSTLYRKIQGWQLAGKRLTLAD